MKLIISSIFLLTTLISPHLSAQYYTGQKVFSSKFPSEVKDYNQDTYILIENSSTDIIVAVENVISGNVIQHAYITSKDSYKFEYIPVGTYVCKYMWTDTYGKKHFEKDDSSMTFKVDEYGGYVITLTEVEYGNLSQSGISEDEFFN